MNTKNDSSILQKIGSIIFEGMIITDLKGHILYINQEMLKYFANIGLENILGTQLSTILRHEKINTFMHHQIPIRGIHVSINNVTFKLNAEKMDHLLVFSFQNMMLYETLKEEKKSLGLTVRAISSILDEIDCGVFYIDQQERIIYCNKKMSLFIGKESHSVINKPYSLFLKEISEENSEDTLLQSLHNETKRFSIQSSFYSNGEQFYFSKETTPLYIGNKKIGALCICKELNFQQFKKEKTPSYLTNFDGPYEKYPLPYIELQSKKRAKAYKTFKTALQTNTRLVLYGEKGTGKTRLVYEYIKSTSNKDQNGLFITGEALSEILSISEVEQVLLEKDISWLILDNPQYFNLKHQAQLSHLLHTHKLKNTVKYILLLDDSPENLIMSHQLNINLFYIFAHYTIELPPLRHNIEDLKHLILTYTKNYCDYIGVPNITFTSQQVEKLCTYPFPGNMNELGIFITEIVSSLPSEKELDEKIDQLLASSYRQRSTSTLDSNDVFSSLEKFLGEANVTSLTDMLEMIEKHLIETKLKESNYHITNTAKSLGITRQNLNYKLNKYNLRLNLDL